MAIIRIPTISAFDVTSEKLIQFNITGNSQFVASSVVKIYDTATNTLVATCPAYNNTSLIARIPPNQSGISNNNSYYLTITAYSGVDGTGNDLGTSSNTQFWCLPEPDVTFSDPSSATTIDITSKSFTAIFDMKFSTTLSVENKIQTYKFILYKGDFAAAVAVDSTEYIYGTGTIDTSNPNKYTITHTFSGLDNNATYFAEVVVNTEQGMAISSTSAIITIHASDIGFATAKVVNMACEGYIEVRGNMTNIVGASNSPHVDANGHVTPSGSLDLNDADAKGNKSYIIWGTPAEDGFIYYPLQFPTSTVNGITTSKWSIGIKGKAFVKSNASPIVSGDDTYLFKLSNQNNTRSIYLYYREDGTNVWVELYATQNNEVNVTSFITSNVLSNVASTDSLNILVRCENGWYDVTIERATT